MAEKIAKTKKLQSVKNENGCTNFGCYSLNGTQAYGVKTRSDQMLSTIYQFDDYEKTYNKTYKVEKGLLGHGNGMCCAEKYMFFACWVKDPKKNEREQQNFLIRVKYGKLTNNLTNGIKITVPETTGAIAFYKKSHLIIKQPKEGTNLKFRIGKINIADDKSKGSFQTIETFYVKNTTGFTRGQDIYYDSKTDYLFIPYCNTANTVNKIMVANLSGSYESYNGKKLYTPQDIIVIDKSSTYSKFEIESLVIDSERCMRMAANVKKEKNDPEDDRIVKITNMTF